MTRLKRIAPLAALFFLLTTASLPSMAALGQFNLGVNMTPYIPNIDSTLTSQGTVSTPIYKCFFNKTMPMVDVDFDFHVLDTFGTLTVGFDFSYGRVSGYEHARTANGGCGEALDSPVAFNLIQIRPQITYLFDPYMEIVPFIPYLRAGIASAIYVFNAQSGFDFKGLPNNSPTGVRFGYEVAFGVNFLLDVFDRNLAQQARGLGVYDHTYLKAEIAYMPITNFGSPGINLSNNFFNTGLPFMLTFGIVFEFQ